MTELDETLAAARQRRNQQQVSQFITIIQYYKFAPAIVQSAQQQRQQMTVTSGSWWLDHSSAICACDLPVLCDWRAGVVDERLRDEVHTSDRAQPPAFVVVDSAASIINDASCRLGCFETCGRQSNARCCCGCGRYFVALDSVA
jgi:hypothetical protein